MDQTPAAELSVPASEARLRAGILRTVDMELAGLEALRQALAGDLGGKVAAVARLVLERPGRVAVTGMGKSGHVGRKLASTLASTGTPALFVHPAEASHGDLGMIGPDDVIIALSWSGEAKELASVLAYAGRFRIALVGITAGSESALANAATHPLVLPRMAEACPNGLAPTTSTTMQMALGDALAMCLLEARGFSAADFGNFHPGGKLGAQLLHARDLMRAGKAMALMPPEALLSEAIPAITASGSGIGGVVDPQGQLLGVLTDGDLRRAFIEGFVDRPVSAVMTIAPVTAEPNALAAALLGKLNVQRITALFVVEHGRPVGVLHVHDLLRQGVG